MFIFSKKFNLLFFFKIFFLKLTNKKEFNNQINFDNQKLLLFSRSRWSLLFIIFLFKKIKKKETIYLWVPSYYCNYALSKINTYEKNIKIIFYPIKKDLNIDYEKFKKNLSECPIDIFLNVNFFGTVSENENIMNLCRSKNSWIVNDSTHCIKPQKIYEKYGDFNLYSPHKFYSIPSGAICKVNLNYNLKFLVSDIDVDYYAHNFIKEYKLNKINIYFKDYITNSIWFIKRFISILYKKISIAEFNSDENDNRYFENKPYPGLFIKKIILNNIVYDKKIFFQRKKSFLIWHKIIDMLNSNKINFKYLTNDNLESYPYALILKTENYQTLSLYNLLKKKKLPISTWPDLSDEIRKNKNFEETIFLRNNLIFLSIHEQTRSQIKLIKSFDLNYNILNNFNLEEVNSISKWNKILDKCEFTYVNQLDEFYKKNFFFKTKKFIIKKNDAEIGLFQIYYMSLGFLKVVRLNFGPCFYEGVDEATKVVAIEYIVNSIFKKSLKFLYLSPNLFTSSETIMNYVNKKIYSFDNNGWSSNVLNLQLPLNILIKNLDGKLRNDIKRKNKDKSSKLIFIKSDNEFDIFLDYYNKEKLKKSFKGISQDKLKRLFSKNKLIIAKYSINDTPETYICVSVQGKTATYLVGINLIKIKSKNDLLLWKIMILLKRNKFKNLDLGGTDFINNYKVSKFKSKFGGEILNLVGSKLLFYK